MSKFRIVAVHPTERADAANTPATPKSWRVQYKPAAASEFADVGDEIPAAETALEIEHSFTSGTFDFRSQWYDDESGKWSDYAFSQCVIESAPPELEPLKPGSISVTNVP